MISLNDNLHNQNQDTFLSSNNEKDKILSLYLSGSISTYEDFIRINSNIDTFIHTFSFRYFNGCYVFFENIALEDLILERFFLDIKIGIVTLIIIVLICVLIYEFFNEKKVLNFLKIFILLYGSMFIILFCGRSIWAAYLVQNKDRLSEEDKKHFIEIKKELLKKALLEIIQIIER